MKNTLIVLLTLGSLTASAQTATQTKTELLKDAYYCTLKVETDRFQHQVTISCDQMFASKSFEVKFSDYNSTQYEDYLSKLVINTNNRMKSHNFINVGCMNTTLFHDSSADRTFQCSYVRDYLNKTESEVKTSEVTTPDQMYNFDVKK